MASATTPATVSPGTVTADAIAFIQTGDNVTPSAESSTQAQSIQNALDARIIRSFKWANAAGRINQLGMQEGDVGDQADTNITYRYDGAAWQSTNSGQSLVIPGSVSAGIVVSQTGRMTFTSSTGFSINNCFTANYDDYMILVDISGASANTQISFRMRAAGTDEASGSAGTGNYDTIGSYQTGTSTSAVTQNGQTSWASGAGANAPIHKIKLELSGPFLPRMTTALQQQGNFFSTGGNGQGISSSAHRLATAYDGFSIFAAGGATMTGTMRIYGMANG